jgi:dTDP-4-amino-4,6-dideoxygalactose transaminase
MGGAETVIDPYQVVRDFEKAVCAYTGAPYCVAVNSCTMALTLAVAWHFRSDRPRVGKWPVDVGTVEIPRRTYVSVPMAIRHAGGWPTFRDEEWIGQYQLKPLPVWDCARAFSSRMFHSPMVTPLFQCVSFHASKILGDTQGGAILHDNAEADAWLRRARFDGRKEGVAPKDDTFTQIGWHAYMSPDVAARLLLKLHSLPRNNEPLPNDDYPDLSTMEIFK